MSDRPANSPNILHVFVDQMRFDCIAALGNTHMITPSLDRLVARATTFTSAYTPCPVCVPARCSMIHGQYPHNTGCYENTSMPTDGRKTVMDALSGAGYRTHGIGKCHFTPDPLALRGFHHRETQEEIPASQDEDDYLSTLRDADYAHIIDPHGARGPMYYIPQIAQMPQELHPTQWVGDRSVDFIRQTANSQTPWDLYSGFIHPHPPFSPPAPWYTLYGFEDIPEPFIPDDAESLWTYVNRAQNRYKYRDQGYDRNLVRIMRAYYYACISFIDYQVGRMLDAIDSRSTDARETLVVFSSDHGEYLGDFGCFGKRGMHDVSARVPLLVSMPGTFDHGTVCDTPVSLVDLAPTFCRAGGVTPSESGVTFDGVALQDVVSGHCKRSTVFAHHAYTREVDATRNGSLVAAGEVDAAERAESSTYMAVSSQYKYVYSALDQREYLFDRVNDPHESRNHAEDPDCASIAGHLRSELHEHLRSGGETAGIDVESGEWKAFPRRELPANPEAGLLVQNQPWASRNIPGYSRSAGNY